MKFKNIITALALSALSMSCFAQECVGNWNLKAKGFTLGHTKEVLKISSEGSIYLTSDFSPNAALRIFGVEAVKRTISLDKNYKLLLRKESIGKDKVTTTTWKYLQGNTYDRTDDTSTEKITVDKMVIDSTIFPYMVYLNMFKDNQMQVTVFGKGAAYNAKISKGEKKLIFEGEQKSGSVTLNEDLYPQSFSFLQDGITAIGTLTSWQCN